MRMKQIQQEKGLQDEDIEVEKRSIRIVQKYQNIFEIPLPTKDPKLVEEASHRDKDEHKGRRFVYT